MVYCIRVKVLTIRHVGFFRCRDNNVAGPIISILLCRGTYIFYHSDAEKPLPKCKPSRGPGCWLGSRRGDHDPTARRRWYGQELDSALHVHQANHMPNQLSLLPVDVKQWPPEGDLAYLLWTWSASWTSAPYITATTAQGKASRHSILR
jgi:hypothetical protein